MKYWIKLIKKIFLAPVNFVFKVEEKFTFEKYKKEKQKRKNLEKSIKLKEEQYVTQRNKVHELQKKFDNINLHNKNLNLENNKLKNRVKEQNEKIEELSKKLKEISEREGINEN